MAFIVKSLQLSCAGLWDSFTCSQSAFCIINLFYVWWIGERWSHFSGGCTAGRGALPAQPERCTLLARVRGQRRWLEGLGQVHGLQDADFAESDPAGIERAGGCDDQPSPRLAVHLEVPCRADGEMLPDGFGSSRDHRPLRRRRKRSRRWNDYASGHFIAVFGPLLRRNWDAATWSRSWSLEIWRSNCLVEGSEANWCRSSRCRRWRSRRWRRWRRRGVGRQGGSGRASERSLERHCRPRRFNCGCWGWIKRTGGGCPGNAGGWGGEVG